MIRRRVALLAAAVIGLLVASLLSSGSASAATWSTLYRPYDYRSCVYSSPLGIGMHVRVNGNLRYDRSPYTWAEGTHDYRNLRLENPTVRSWATRNCSSTTAVSYRGADLYQYWWEYSCNDSIQISAGFPWSAGIGYTSNCGNERRGYRKTTPRITASHHEQYNTGAPVYYNKTYVRVPWVCVDFTATAVLYKGTASDSVSKRNYQFCTPWIHG